MSQNAVIFLLQVPYMIPHGVTVLVHAEILLGTSFRGVTRVGVEEVYLAAVAASACNMLWCQCTVLTQ